ncbi:hypothetical protein [Streptomyces sp. NPDC059017]|uniref:hypothetical protein n=1 Tax=unclassified Streptomyces TaxID=2593676 RepID=UPI0036C2D63A
MSRSKRAEARRRRPAWWNRAWGLLVVPLAVMAGAAGIVVLVTVPDSVNEVRAFRSARPCTFPQAVAADCLRTYPATVRGTAVENQGRSQLYLLKLDGPPPIPAELDMDGEVPLLKHLRKGDHVTVTVWRDYAPAVTKDGVTQESTDTPEGWPEFQTAFALDLLTVGGYGGFAGTTAVRHARRRSLPDWVALWGRWTMGAVVVSVPAGIIGYETGTGPVVVALLWLALLPAVWLVVKRRERHDSGRHSRRPAPSRAADTGTWPRYLANWWRSVTNAFWALDRVLGGQRRPTRFQKWVGRHPTKAGLCVGTPAALFYVLFFVMLSDEAELEDILVATLFGLSLGLIFGLTAASERLRQRRLKRLGIWDGS